MKSLSVIELADLYKLNRQTIYKRIKKGDLSKNSDGKIDLSEAIRVFGEPSNYNKPDVALLQSTAVQKETEVDILKQQVDILKKQLELAHEREIFQREQLAAKDNQIDAIQRLLEAPKTNMPTFIDQKTDKSDKNNEPTVTPKQEDIQEENKRIPVPEIREEEPPKRGFWSKFFLPNG